MGGGLETLQAEQLTAGLDHFGDQEIFAVALGFELVADSSGDSFELFAVLVGEDGEDAGEAMAGGVGAGGCFSFGRFRTRTMSGILPVCEDLCLSAHPTLRLAGGEKNGDYALDTE